MISTSASIGEPGWSSLCADATDLLARMSAVFLIDATLCGVAARPVLQESLSPLLDRIRSRLPTSSGSARDEHLRWHLTEAVSELHWVANTLSQRLVGRDGAQLQARLARASGHLKKIAGSSGSAALFDISQCCGGHHERMVVN